MRAQAVPLLLLVLVVAGCAGPATDGQGSRSNGPPAVGYDPTSLHIVGYTVENHTVRSSDGATDLAVTVYVPTVDPAPAGGARFPLAVFLHGWGGSRADYTGASQVPAPLAGQAPADPTAGIDRLAQFALGGMVALAYDARGFGDSTGTSTIAGEGEQADLAFMLAWGTEHYPTNGKVGVLGRSYGAGQALLAMTRDTGIDAVVSMYGWADLAEGLIPGDVPKLEWGNFLVGYGAAGSRGRIDPILVDWYGQAFARTELDRVRAEMAPRSAGAALANATQPLLLCQGMQETLFPQQDAIARLAGGFVRSYYFTGGHGADDAGCWARAQLWFQQFLGGYDVGVDAWPLLDTVDANGVDHATYATWPRPAPTTYRLRNQELSSGPASATTFTIEQRTVAPPIPPDAFYDQAGLPRPLVPGGLATDPSSVTFTTPPVAGEPILVGAPTLRLRVTEPGTYPFQVVGGLYRVTADGSAQLLGRGAVAAVDAAHVDNGWATMRFPFTHARLAPGDQLALRLSANDAGAYYPLAAVYSVTFTGASELSLPILA